MSESRSRSFAWRLAAEAALLLTTTAAFFSLYLTRFHQPISSLSAHIGLLLSAWIGLVGLRLVAWTALPNTRLVSWLSAALFTGAFSILFFYYVLVLVGLHSWGRVVSSRLISTYSVQIGGMLSSAGLSSLAAAALVCLLLAAGGLLLWVSLRVEWVGTLRQNMSSGWPARF